MDSKEHDRLESWTKNYAVLALMGYLSFLLILGKLFHHFLLFRGFFCRVAVVPPAILSGLFGLLWLSFMQSIDPIITSDLVQGLTSLNANLVNFVFASLALGLFCTRKSSQHLNVKGIVTSIVHEGMPMVIYSQILSWGQSSICLLISCIMANLNIPTPKLFPAMVPLGLEAGSDVLPTAVYNNYWSQTVVQEAETLGLLTCCLMGVIAISVKHYYVPSAFSRSVRHDLYAKSAAELQEFETFGVSSSEGSSASTRVTGQDTSPHLKALNNISDIPGHTLNIVGSIAPSSSFEEQYPLPLHIRPPTIATLPLDMPGTASPLPTTPRPMRSKHHHFQSSLGIHVSVIFISVFISFNFGLFARIFEGNFKWFQTHRILSGIQMFEISIVCSVILMYILLTKTHVRFKSEWFMRLCGLMLDMIVIAAFSIAIPNPSQLEQVNYKLVSIFVLACAAWNIFVFVFFAKIMFPNFWYERGVTLTSEAMGHSFLGLLFVRSIDPGMQTPVPVAYACKLMLFLFPSAGGKNTIVVSLLVSHGPWVALCVCLSVVIAWVYIFEKFFRGRFVFDDNMKLTLESSPLDNTTGSHSMTENQPLLSPQKEDEWYEDLLEEVTAEDELMDHSNGVQLSDMTNTDKGTNNNKDKFSSRRNSSIGNIQDFTSSNPLALERGKSSSIVMNGVSAIVSQSQMQVIAKWLPESQSCLNFNLKYSLRRDGAMLEALISSCNSQRQKYKYNSCILLIEDSWGYIFGAYIAHSLQNSNHYYGNGESFVFTIAPLIEVFHWTGVNDFFILSNYDHIAVGGGGDGFAFQLDDELCTGISNRSDTYANKRLSSSEFFKCLNVELWSLE
jgi:hypothetical protein